MKSKWHDIRDAALVICGIEVIWAIIYYWSCVSKGITP